MSEVAKQTDDGEIFVLARNPTEMRSANAALLTWVDKRLASVANEGLELSSALDKAVVNKWQTKPLRNAVRRSERRHEYYVKIREALAAGYSIIPNFPIDVFAIRTNRTPRGNNIEATNWKPTPNDQETDSPPLGIGAFVSPQTEIQRDSHLVTKKDGSEVTVHEAWAGDWRDVDFPVAFAKPAIMEATREALALKCFDEIGIFKDSAFSRRSGDPMVIGRVRMRTGGYQSTALSFAIAWFLHTESI